MSSDQDLVRATLLGDRKAPEALLLRHLAVLRRDAHDRDWQLPEGMDVDDALQAFFEKVCANDFRALVQWQGLDDPAGPSIAPYFRSILRNLMTDLGRQRQAEPRHDWPDDEPEPFEEIEGETERPDDAVASAQLRAAIAACIATTLKPTQQKVIALHLDDRPHREIAERLGLSVANSRVILNRALEALARCLKARLRNAGAGAAVWE
jgi:RNA polymerase sigma factor (sigma-70 family)